MLFSDFITIIQKNMTNFHEKTHLFQFFLWILTSLLEISKINKMRNLVLVHTKLVIYAGSRNSILYSSKICFQKNIMRKLLCL